MSSLVPDLYHVLNASYCSVYATEEAGQIEYAALSTAMAPSVAQQTSRSNLANDRKIR